MLLIYLITGASGVIGLLMLSTTGLAALTVFCCGLGPPLVIFRHFGAIRFRQALLALRQNRYRSRDARAQKQKFEELQLRIREATTLGDWWQIVRRAARNLGFARVTIELRNGDSTGSRLIWHLPGRDANGRALHMSLPVRHGRGGESVRANIDIPVDGSLELAGSHVALFGRLIDECSLADLPDYPANRTTVGPAGGSQSEGISAIRWGPSSVNDPKNPRGRHTTT